MPIELSWMVPDKILLSRWFNEVNGDDMQVLIEELRIILDTARQPVHIIFDLAQVIHISPEVAYVYLRSSVPRHPRNGRVGMVSATFQGEVIADLINRLSQREMVRLFDTRADAREFLLQHDTPPPVLRFDLNGLSNGDDVVT